MTTFNLKSKLNFNADKEFVPCLNEYSQKLAVIDFNEVYEGYKLSCYKWTPVKSDDTNQGYYEVNSNSTGSPVQFKTLEEMCEYINEWKNELINESK